MNRRIAILDAPSNLGLRPPTETSVPGCGKAPGALRDHDLLSRLDARDAGCLTPPRYDPADWRPGDGVCHAPAIARYSVALADRIGAIIDAGEFPVILGGDCSILLGSALAMHRLGEAVGGRIGLVFVDGHSDFRHPGNASYVGAAAGEDLALVTGRGQADLAGIEGRRPYFRDIDVVVLGIRTQDEYRLDLQAAGIVTRAVPLLRTEGAARTAQWAHDQLADCAGYWVHIDVDVLDPAVMPAVDAPDPGGIAFAELELLISGLVDTPHCLGVEITVFDPDYDPDGAYAAEIVSTLVAGLSPVHRADPTPPPAGTVWFGPGGGVPDPTEDPTAGTPLVEPVVEPAVEPAVGAASAGAAEPAARSEAGPAAADSGLPRPLRPRTGGTSAIDLVTPGAPVQSSADMPTPVELPAGNLPAASVIGLAEQVAAAGAAARDNAGRAAEPQIAVPEPDQDEQSVSEVDLDMSPDPAAPPPARPELAAQPESPAQPEPVESPRPEPVGPPASAGPGRLRRISAADIVIGSPAVAPEPRDSTADAP